MHDLTSWRFTDAAALIISQIGDRAGDRAMLPKEFSADIAVMLAVLSIVRWERKVALVALEQLGTDLDQFARELDAAIDAERQVTQRDDAPPYLDEVVIAFRRPIFVEFDALRPLLELAQLESRNLGHDYIGTEHLLLAAARVACPRFREVLERHKISHDRVREAVLDLLRPPIWGP